MTDGWARVHRFRRQPSTVVQAPDGASVVQEPAPDAAPTFTEAELTWLGSDEAKRLAGQARLRAADDAADAALARADAYLGSVEPDLYGSPDDERTPDAIREQEAVAAQWQAVGDRVVSRPQDVAA